MVKKRTWERRMDEAKRKHRPSLKNWAKDGFATHRHEEFLKLQQLDNKYPGVPIIDINKISVEQFKREYEAPFQPCIITGIPEAEEWQAVKNWSFSKLKVDYKNRMFKVGEDDDGYKVKTKLRYFMKYLKNNKDDSPLYVFDSSFDDDTVSKTILRDYQVPRYFDEDLFKLVGEKRRPPYRWFLIGPERSGTSVHLDPLGTSAWNTLLQGHKRWIFFPPGTGRRIAKGLDVIKKGEDDEAINYFVDLVPRIKAQYPDIPILELIQNPGETIFVPGGWWHGVLNLDDTIAITQNYCSAANFDRVWTATRKGRKKMSLRWLKELHKHAPRLGQRAVQLNDEDGFVMHDKVQAKIDKALKKNAKQKAKEEKAEAKKRKEMTTTTASTTAGSVDDQTDNDRTISTTTSSSSASSLSDPKAVSKKKASKKRSLEVEDCIEHTTTKRSKKACM